MPIRVTCSCGKVFRVKDEFAGRQIQCQVCQAEVTVPELPELGEEPSAHPEPSPSAPSSAPDQAPAHPQGATIECSACAENIPAGSVFCPLCGEELTDQVDASQAAQMLQASLDSLDSHLGDMQGRSGDYKLKGGFLATKTIVAMVFMALCIGLIVLGAQMRRDGEPLIVIGVILAIIFGIALLVSLTNDYRSSHIQDRRDPAQALKNFLTAVRTKRTARAFACLAPQARKSGKVKTVTFQKVKSSPDSFDIRDVESFGKYWASIFRGPSGHTRGVQIKKIRKLKEGDQGLAVVEAELAFSSYPSWLIATILLNVLICVVLILICTKREKLTIRKLLVKRENRWFFVESQLQGPLDKVAVV